MSDAEWTTIRIRVRVVQKIDKMIEANNAAAPIPAKTSRSDVVEAALDAANRYAQVVAAPFADTEMAPPKTPKRKKR